MVGEDAPSRYNVPTLHLSEFAALLKQSNLESYQALLHPRPPDTPFAFILSPRLELDASSYHHYIAPAEVILRPDVPAWRFEVDERQLKPPNPVYWYTVTHAEPLR